jgi:thiol-disulfide isomerase/thioredoxin
MALAGLALAGGALGLYALRPAGKNIAAHAGPCARSLDLAQAIDPLIHGEVAALTIATEPHPLGAIAFDTNDGSKTSVDAFKGKTILLNLWATWCVPCRAEMPSLDKLQSSLASTSFSVVPVNVDTARLDKPRAFLKDIGATSLPYYSDNSADILQALKHSEPITGLPTSILIGPDACEIATMAGPADWNSSEAKALIERLKSGPV